MNEDDTTNEEEEVGPDLKPALEPPKISAAERVVAAYKARQDPNLSPFMKQLIAEEAGVDFSAERTPEERAADAAAFNRLGQPNPPPIPDPDSATQH